MTATHLHKYTRKAIMNTIVGMEDGVPYVVVDDAFEELKSIVDDECTRKAFAFYRKGSELHYSIGGGCSMFMFDTDGTDPDIELAFILSFPFVMNQFADALTTVFALGAIERLSAE